MYGATAKGVKTRPSFQDMILPKVLPGNDCLTWNDGRVFTVAPSM
jgi:hypothetical protein